MLEAELVFERCGIKAVIKGSRNEHSGKSIETIEILYNDESMLVAPIEDIGYSQIETVFILRKIIRKAYSRIDIGWRNKHSEAFQVFVNELNYAIGCYLERDFRIYHEKLSFPHELCPHLTLLSSYGGVRIYLHDTKDSSDSFALSFINGNKGYEISANICVRHDAHIRRKEVYIHENGRITDPDVLFRESMDWIAEFVEKWHPDRNRIGNMKTGIKNRWPNVRETIVSILDRINQGKHI